MSQIIFEPLDDKAGEHRWHAVHVNGNIMADSSEGYKNKEDARLAFITLVNAIKSTPWGELLAKFE